MLPEKERDGRGRGPLVWTALAGVVLLVALGLALALARPAMADQAMDFSDVNPEHPYYHAIEGLYWAGVIDGYETSQGKMFRPTARVLRAQFAKMILGALSVEVSESDWQDSARPFTDFESDDPSTLYPHDYVAAALRLGITTGKTATTFEPFEDISRIQLITMVVRAARALKPDAVRDPPTGWTGVLGSYYSDPNHGQNVRTAEYSGLLNGLVGMGSGWDADAKATRGEAAQIMWNLYNGGGPRLVYSDDFSDPKSGWTLVSANDNYKCGYQPNDQWYSITIFVPNRAAFAWRSEESYADFALEVRGGAVASEPSGEYGLLFRMQDGDNCYCFSVSNEGSWRLRKRVSGEWQAIVPSTNSDAVVTGDYWNRLGVACAGSSIRLFINGEQVGSAEDTTFTSGWAGLMGGSFDSGGVQLVFDDLKVWVLE
jgi:hypothetical protein